MGESYLPHSVRTIHEKVLTLRKLFVHLVHRPKVKSQESYRPAKTQGLCDPWSRGWALLRTLPMGSSKRLQCRTASQTVTESYEDTINHVPDKKSGRGGWERRGALAGWERRGALAGWERRGALAGWERRGALAGFYGTIIYMYRYSNFRYSGTLIS